MGVDSAAVVVDMVVLLKRVRAVAAVVVVRIVIGNANAVDIDMASFGDSDTVVNINGSKSLIVSNWWYSLPRVVRTKCVIFPRIVFKCPSHPK